MGPMVKYTENLILRVENENKAKAVLDLYLRNKDEFEKYEPTRPDNFYTIKFHENMLAREHKMYRLGSFLRYFIYAADNPNRIIGAVNFNFLSDGTSRFSEIGYKVDSQYHNKGVGYEACTAGIAIMKECYGFKRFDARIHPKNEASLRLAEKLGFSFVRIEPQSANILGSYVDLARYSLNTSITQ